MRGEKFFEEIGIGKRFRACLDCPMIRENARPPWPASTFRPCFASVMGSPRRPSTRDDAPACRSWPGPVTRESKVPYDDNDDHASRISRHRLGPRALDRGPAPGGAPGLRAGLFHLAGAGRLRVPALADGRDRHLHDVSPAADPPQLRHAAQVAGIRADGHRLLRLGRGADRLGGRPPPASRAFRRRGRCPQPQPRLRLGAHVLVDDPRHHRRSYAGIL